MDATNPKACDKCMTAPDYEPCPACGGSGRVPKGGVSYRRINFDEGYWLDASMLDLEGDR
jgi:hypothetical protein